MFKYTYLNLPNTLQYLPNTLQYLPKTLHTFDIYYNTIIILQYTFIYVKIVLKLLYSAPLCLLITLFFKIVMAPHYSLEGNPLQIDTN
jgi:hypothetical protein